MSGDEVGVGDRRLATAIVRRLTTVAQAVR
jgi:hypothetical protein